MAEAAPPPPIEDVTVDLYQRPSSPSSLPLPFHHLARPSTAAPSSDDDDSADITPFIHSADPEHPALPSTPTRSSSSSASSSSSSSAYSCSSSPLSWRYAVASVGCCLVTCSLLLASVGVVLTLAAEGRLVELPQVRASILSLGLWLHPNDPLPPCDAHPWLSAGSIQRTDPQPSLLLAPLDTFLVQHCLGWGVDAVDPALDTSASSPSNCTRSVPITSPSVVTSSSPLPTPSTSHLTCNLSPASVMSTFFPDQLALYPGVLTHLPQPSCDRGVFVVMDEPYRDGMGNHMWSQAMDVALALALNATVVHDDFHASHAETEGMRMREAVFRLSEWDAPREWWDRCDPSSMVRRNEVTVEHVFYDFHPLNPALADLRAQIRLLQVILAREAGTLHMNATLDANSTFRFLDADSLNYTDVSLPRVDFISPGMTIHFKGIQLTHDSAYQGGLYPPAFAVSRIMEMRYISQQDGWRRKLFPMDLEDLEEGGGRRSGGSGSAVEQPLRSWRTSDLIHVAVPVRRGDVTAGTAGKDLKLVLDLRQRAVTDEAVVQLLAQMVNLTRALPSFDLPSFSSTSPIQLAGPDVLSRMRFTVYSEGRSEDFVELILALQALGLREEQVRLHLGGRPSWVFNLMVESDVNVLAPSSFSYAAACYFNTESLKVGSGWSWGRFWGCRNFVFAPWVRYVPAHPDGPVWSVRNISQPQTWRIEDEADFQQRLVRLLQRKFEQRRRLEPIVVDNYRGEYPPQWVYGQRRQRDVEIAV